MCASRLQNAWSQSVLVGSSLLAREVENPRVVVATINNKLTNKSTPPESGIFWGIYD